MLTCEVNKLDAISILKPETFATLLDTESEIERIELEETLLNQAEELGVLKAFKKRLTAYKKDNIKVNPFRCDFTLSLNDKGNPVASIDNFLQILRNDINYSNTFYLNELTGSPEHLVENKRCRWTDSDDSELRRYIEKNYKIHNEKKLDDALRIVFNENLYNPVKELVEGTKWDGVSRMKTVLTKWLKVADEPYTQEVSRLIFAGGIHRLYNPGCKFDDMPVLVGRQGEGKSTFVRWLALSDAFFREVTEIEGQRGIEALEGAWICEMGELLALTRSKDVEAVKSYITRLCDTYRKPFDKRTSDHKRQCVFIGTTNKPEFLTDKTGNRRYYPVICNNSGYDLFNNQAEIKNDILQCWAEAKALYDEGQLHPYADEKLLDTIRAHQADAVEDDYRIGMIEDYLDTHDIVCVVELWQEALNEYGKPGRKDSNEIATIMQSFRGWEKASKAIRINPYGVQKYWYKCNQLELNEQKKG